MKFFGLAALAMLAGCAAQPPYQRPAIAPPAQFKRATPAAQAAGIWRPAQPQDAALPQQWWRLFGDPELDRLQQQAADERLGNPGIAQAVARLRAAQAAVAGSRAGLLPALGASGGATRARGAAGTGTGGGAAASSYTLGLNASWELDLWGRLSGAVDASVASAQASSADLAAARLSLQALLAQTYFALRAAEAQGLLLQDTLNAYEQSWQLTRNRERAGVASPADVAQAEAQYKSTQAQLLEAATSRAQLEHALAALLGLAPGAFDLQATGALPAPPAVPAELPAQLLQQRPDIAAAQLRVAAANAQVGVAQAAYFPALTLSAAAGYRGAQLRDLVSAPHLFWSLGPALALSLFDGGARGAAVESARAALDLASAGYRQSVITALQEVEDNLVAATALAQEQQLQSEAVAAAQRALQIVTNQYQAGTVGYLNVLSAQATVLAARRSLIDVQNRRLTAVNTLLKNVAGRWAYTEG
ncbi:efflux transporter outer membrane subunit [Alicycliphilus denitrificans]|uniref:efflux transporter outer membrane subunit n=1 Tax=Alicycliphilus denitrificans TaxID=179636 RepID=UPI00385073CE